MLRRRHVCPVCSANHASCGSSGEMAILDLPTERRVPEVSELKRYEMQDGSARLLSDRSALALGLDPKHGKPRKRSYQARSEMIVVDNPQSQIVTVGRSGRVASEEPAPVETIRKSVDPDAIAIDPDTVVVEEVEETIVQENPEGEDVIDNGEQTVEEAGDVETKADAHNKAASTPTDASNKARRTRQRG